MLGQAFRQKLKKTLHAAAKPLTLLPLSANQFSALAVPLAMASAFFIATQNWVWATIFFFLAILIDLLDGSFAKLKNQQSPFGNYFDATVDKTVECTLFVGFAFVEPILAILALCATMLESYAKPRAGLVIISDNHDWPALGEHAERVMVLGAGLVLAIVFPNNAVFWVFLSLAVVFIITLIGFVQRVQYARALIEKAQRENQLLPYLRVDSEKRKQKSDSGKRSG